MQICPRDSLQRISFCIRVDSGGVISLHNVEFDNSRDITILLVNLLNFNPHYTRICTCTTVAPHSSLCSREANNDGRDSTTVGTVVAAFEELDTAAWARTTLPDPPALLEGTGVGETE